MLENGVTHQTRSIALEIVKTSSPIAVAQSLRPRDLLEPGQQLTRPGGEQLTDGNGQQLNDPNNEQLATSGNGLTGAILQLLQIVQQFIMNAQQLTRDDQKGIPKDPPKGDVTPKPNPLDCRQGVPTATTPPAEALAYFARCPDGP